MKNSILLILISWILVSCSETPVNHSIEENDSFLNAVNIIPVEGWNFELNNSTRSEDFIIDSFIDKESILYISQFRNGLIPFSSDINNIYKYRYEVYNEIYSDVNWEEGYNFFPQEKKDMLSWETVGLNGPYQNGYWLYALHFPYNNEPVFSVQSDQSTLSGILASNIMGGFHSTSALYTRLRFYIYHLMAYMKVTVYVPSFRQEKDEKGNDIFTGFFTDAIQYGTILGVYPDFEIDWRHAVGDNAAPFTEADLDGEAIDIPLYLHEKDLSNLEIKKLRLSDYTILDNQDENSDEETDDVYELTFSVFFPGGQPENFTVNKFLRFGFKENSGSKIRNYTYTGKDTGFHLSQGEQQNIILYLPRNGGEAILVSAFLEEWKEAGSDIYLKEQ